MSNPQEFEEITRTTSTVSSKYYRFGYPDLPQILNKYKDFEKRGYTVNVIIENNKVLTSNDEPLKKDIQRIFLENYGQLVSLGYSNISDVVNKDEGRIISIPQSIDYTICDIIFPADSIDSVRFKVTPSAGMILTGVTANNEGSVTILHKSSVTGIVENYEAIVVDGYATVEVSDLSPFLIMYPETFEILPIMFIIICIMTIVIALGAQLFRNKDRKKVIFSHV